jgi:hypothetical protein
VEQAVVVEQSVLLVVQVEPLVVVEAAEELPLLEVWEEEDKYGFFLGNNKKIKNIRI